MKRFSAQRQAVYEAVCGTKCHPTADWVYEEVRKIMPKISLGTVYRNLSELKCEGTIFGFADSAGAMHYDATTLPHLHFECSECGKVIDVPADVNYAELTGILESFGIEVAGALHLYFGKCSDCKKQN